MKSYKAVIFVLILILGLSSFFPKENSEDVPLETVKPHVTIADFSYEEEIKNYREGDPGVKTSGFVNTTIVSASTDAESTDHAKKECTIEWDTIETYLDTGACMWKHVFYKASDPSKRQTVYINYEGITTLIVYAE